MKQINAYWIIYNYTTSYTIKKFKPESFYDFELWLYGDTIFPEILRIAIQQFLG